MIFFFFFFFSPPPAPAPKKKEQTNLRKQFSFQFPAGLCRSSYSVIAQFPEEQGWGGGELGRTLLGLKIAHVSTRAVQPSGRRKRIILICAISSSRAFRRVAEVFYQEKVTGHRVYSLSTRRRMKQCSKIGLPGPSELNSSGIALGLVRGEVASSEFQLGLFPDPEHDLSPDRKKKTYCSSGLTRFL